MSEKRYMISDASKEIDVEPHVLRYWEEELGIGIPRNEMGHRYYRQEDIDTLISVKELKEKGFQLKAIKLLLPDISKVEALENERLMDLRDKLDAAMALAGSDDNTPQALTHPGERALPADDGAQVDKLHRFHDIMCNIMKDTLIENNETLEKQIVNTLRDAIIKEMDYLFRNSEEQEEERFRQLDRTIRDYQTGRQQVAATGDIARKSNNKKRNKLFGRGKGLL